MIIALGSVSATATSHMEPARAAAKQPPEEGAGGDDRGARGGDRPAGGGGGAKHAQPELLQALYARIEPLGAYLQRTLRRSAPLIRADDPQDYRYVLERCLVAQSSHQPAPAADGSAPRSPASAPRLASSQPEVVRQVIETLFRESAHPDHVLALGHCRPRFGGTSSNAFHGVEQLVPSSAASALQTQPWAMLLQRVGDAAMMAMLLERSLFLPTRGGTLLQLSGAPVNKVVHQLRAPPPPPAADPVARDRAAPRAVASPPYKRPVRMLALLCTCCPRLLWLQPVVRARLTLRCWLCVLYAHDVSVCVQRPAGSGHASEEPQSGPTLPPATLSSHGVTPEMPVSQMQWAMEAAAAAAAAAVGGSAQPEPTPTLQMDGTAPLAEQPLTVPQEQEQAAAQEGGADAGSTAPGHGRGAAAAAASAAYPARPMRMISRRKLFYNFHFSKMVGLPHDHPLAICGDTLNGARRLFHQVFTTSSSSRAAASAARAAAAAGGAGGAGGGGQASSQQGGGRRKSDGGGGSGSQGSQSSQGGRQQHGGASSSSSRGSSRRRQRVDGFSRPLLPLLLEVIQRHKRAPYARILEHHCPLPPELNQGQPQQPQQQRAAASSSADAGGGPAAAAAAAAAATRSQTTAAGGGDTRKPSDHSRAPDAKTKAKVRAKSPRGATATAQNDSVGLDDDELETQPTLPISLPLPALTPGAAAAAAAERTPDLPLPSSSASPMPIGPTMRAGGGAKPPSAAAAAAAGGGDDDAFDAVIRLHSPHYAVAGFVKTSLRFLIPVEFWGGEENMRTCFKHIDRFVRLRRFENFSLKEATHGLKSRNFPPSPTPSPAASPAVDAAGAAQAGGVSGGGAKGATTGVKQKAGATQQQQQHTKSKKNKKRKKKSSPGQVPAAANTNATAAGSAQRDRGRGTSTTSATSGASSSTSGGSGSGSSSRNRRREHPNRLRVRQRLLEDWVFWIFTQLVVPLSKRFMHHKPQHIHNIHPSPLCLRMWMWLWLFLFRLCCGWLIPRRDC